jgi:hypothetical protein
MKNTRLDKLYTAKEAREKLGGMAPTSFKRLVDSGKIRKVTPPHKTNSLYLKEDVDKVAAIMHEFVEIYSSDNNQGYTFTQANGEEDIKETVQIAQQRFGTRATNLESRMERFRKSPTGDYILKHNEVIVGFFSMQAVKQETVEGLFEHKTAKGLSVDDIEPIIPGKPLEIIVSNIASRLGVDKHLEAEYGKRLILEVIKLFIHLGKEGIEIHRVWAMSSTVYGIKLCRDIFRFQEIGYVNNEQLGFVLTIEQTESPIIKQYLEALRGDKTSTVLDSQSDSQRH